MTQLYSHTQVLHTIHAVKVTRSDSRASIDNRPGSWTLRLAYQYWNMSSLEAHKFWICLMRVSRPLEGTCALSAFSWGEQLPHPP